MYVYIYHADSPHNIKLPLFIRPLYVAHKFGSCSHFLLAFKQKEKGLEASWGAAPNYKYIHVHVRTKPENKLLTFKLSTLDHANICLVMEHFINKFKYVI